MFSKNELPNDYIDKGFYPRGYPCTEMNMTISNSRDHSLDSNDMASWVMESDPISPMCTLSAHEALIKQFTSNKNEAVRIAAAKFQSSLQTPDVLLDMLISREGLSLNGSKLTYQSCEQQNAKGLLTAVESVYPGMSIADMKQSSRNNVGYSLFDPGRLGGSLKMIGFSEDAISAMRLRDVIKYDAAIWVQANHAIESSSLYKYQAMLSIPELVSFSFDSSGSPAREELIKNDRMLMETFAVNTDFNRLLHTAFAEVIKADLILAQKTAPPKDLARRTMPLCLTNPSSELCFMRSNEKGRFFTTFNPVAMSAGGLSNEAIFHLIMKEYRKGGYLVVPRVRPTVQMDSVEDLPQAAPTPIQNNPPNYSFLIATLAHPATKVLSVIILMASLLLLGLVTAGLSSMPVMAGTVLAAVGMFSGAGMSMGNRWAMQQSSDKTTTLSY